MFNFEMPPLKIESLLLVVLFSYSSQPSILEFGLGVPAGEILLDLFSFLLYFAFYLNILLIASLFGYI
jgi:hypothetical protein